MSTVTTAMVTLALLAGAAAPAAADDVTFTPGPGSPAPLGQSNTDIAAADLDGDGFDDAVLGEWGATKVTVRWGRADGGFDAPTTVSLPAPVTFGGMALGDVAGSALPDIVLASDDLLAIVSDGDRTFTVGTPAPVEPSAPGDFSAGSAAVADFDGDGDGDLAATVLDRTSSDREGFVRAFAGDGSGTFTKAGDHDPDRENLSALVTGRFNADDDPDLAYQYYVPPDPPDIEVPSQVFVGILLGAPGMGFTQGTPIEIFGEVDNPDLQGAADLDRPADGFDDLFFTASIDVHWANGDGTFSAEAQEIDDGVFADLLAGDMTGDGATDLIGIGGETTRLMANRGGRTFARDAEIDLPSAYEFRFIAGAVGEFDADPLDDLAVLADGDGDEEIEISSYLARPTGSGGGAGTGGGGGGDTAPPPGGSTEPPAATSPPPGGSPSPAATPPVPVTARQIATLPSSRRCASRRNFRIRLRRPPAGVTVSEARVLVNGKRVKVVRGARLTAPVDLRGLPKGKVVVAIRITLSDGRVLRGRRAYRTCATKKRKGKFGRRRG